MKGYICARFGELLRKTAAATTIFAILTTLFLFTPARSETSKNFVKSWEKTQSGKPFVSTGLVISQFQGAGGTQNDEFIELHNTSSNQVDINGLRVVYRSATGTNDVLFAEWTESTIIPAGGYYLIASNSYDGAVPPNFIYNTSTCSCALSATTGGIAIRSGELNTGEIIDSVGYGTATNIFVETAVTGAPATNGSKERNNAGCADTDNNSADFSALNPSAPRNDGTAVNICPQGVPTLSINNVTMAEGSSGTTTFTFTVSLSAPAGAGGVTFDISTADGTATTADNDYVARSLTGQTIAEGSQNYSFDVTVIGDTAIEPTESFSVNVTSVTGAPVADGSAVGTITTDDANLSAAGTSAPSTVQAGNTALLKVTVTPATNPPSSGITVTGDLSFIGGSPAQTFFNDGTNGDTTANDNVFSYLATVTAETTNGAKSLPVVVTDAQSRNANTTIGLTVGITPSNQLHLTMGNPSNATTDVNNPFNYLLLKDQYAMSYHRDRAIPNWVSWHLDSGWLGSTNRQDDFRPDSTLPAGWYQVTDGSYSGSGFNRGHHTPSGDRTSSVVNNSATFLMTNMMPQAGGNNQGPWEKLESYSRTLIGGNELYTITGSVGTGGTGDNGFASTIDGGRVTVPAQTWKVIIILPVGDNDVARVNNNTRTIGVIMPNINSILSDSWQKYITTVDQVETLTGYNFFLNVDPAIQAMIESRLDSANNSAPSASSQSKTTAEDANVNITLAATDANVNNQLTYTIVNNPANGTLSGTGANLTYTPNANYFGPDSFTFKASDGTADSNTATVSITVTEVNDAPVAVADSKTTSSDTTLIFAAGDLTANDNTGSANESSAQTLTVTQVITTAQTNGTVSLSGGQITYTPNAGFTGQAAFDYQVCDNGTTGGAPNVKCSIATVTVNVGQGSSNSLSGVVSYGTTAAGAPAVFVPDVLMTAAGTPQATETTDSSGAYLLSNLGAGSYTVTPSKATQTINTGISLQDASEVAKYVFNQRTFTPNQLIAADATGDGTVSLQDASEIAKRAFNISSTNIVGQWKFVPASRSYASVNGNIPGQNYEAVLVGDVTGNWTAQPPPANRPQTEETIAEVETQKGGKAELFIRDWRQAKGNQMNSKELQKVAPISDTRSVTRARLSLSSQQNRESRNILVNLLTIEPIWSFKLFH